MAQNNDAKESYCNGCSADCQICAEPDKQDEPVLGYCDNLIFQYLTKERRIVTQRKRLPDIATDRQLTVQNLLKIYDGRPIPVIKDIRRIYTNSLTEAVRILKTECGVKEFNQRHIKLRVKR